MTLVWIHRPERNTWCVLRRATGGRIITLCCDWFDGTTPVHILTSGPDPSDHPHPRNGCPACEGELRAGTPGAVVVPRTVTPNLRGPLGVEDLSEEWVGGDESEGTGC